MLFGLFFTFIDILNLEDRCRVPTMRLLRDVQHEVLTQRRREESPLVAVVAASTNTSDG